MRILHVLGKLDRGGVETWLVQLLEHVDRLRYQMDFVVHTTNPGAYDEQIRSLGARSFLACAPIVRLNMRGVFGRSCRRMDLTTVSIRTCITTADMFCCLPECMECRSESRTVIRPIRRKVPAR